MASNKISLESYRIFIGHFTAIFVSPAEQMRDLGVAISGNGGDGGGDGGSIGSAGGVNFPRLKFISFCRRRQLPQVKVLKFLPEASTSPG